MVSKNNNSNEINHNYDSTNKLEHFNNKKLFYLTRPNLKCSSLASWSTILQNFKFSDNQKIRTISPRRYLLVSSKSGSRSHISFLSAFLARLFGHWVFTENKLMMVEVNHYRCRGAASEIDSWDSAAPRFIFQKPKHLRWQSYKRAVGFVYLFVCLFVMAAKTSCFKAELVVLCT